MDVLLRVRGLVKHYGATCALDSVDLTLEHGEVHAILGENGSGKSTLVKVLSGVTSPDGGSVEWNGVRIRVPSSPRRARALGIATVFQETLVVPEMSIVDNVVMGLDGTLRHLRSAHGYEVDHVADRLEEIGLAHVDPRRPVWTLSLSQQQLVTIARAVLRDWQLLILDEATSALDVLDRNRLLNMVTSVRGSRRAVLLITHRMDEIVSSADRVTVLRSGQDMGTFQAQSVTTEELVSRLSPSEGGNAHRIVYGANRGKPTVDHLAGSGTCLVRVRQARIHATAPLVSAEIYEGEILGLAGLEGHGQRQLLRAIAGLDRMFSGNVEIRDKNGYERWCELQNLQASLRQGIILVPGDRKGEGLFSSLSVRDNLAMASFTRWSVLGWLKVNRMERELSPWLKRLAVVPNSLRPRVSVLSGGNQQKVLIGRALLTTPRVLLLDDPTRGVDASAKMDIGRLFEASVADGVTVVLLSTEVSELARLCDRVLVFRERAVARELKDGEITEDNIVAAMFGASGQGAE